MESSYLNFRENSLDNKSFLKESVVQNNNNSVSVKEYEVWLEDDCYLVDCKITGTYEDQGVDGEKNFVWKLSDPIITLVIKVEEDGEESTIEDEAILKRLVEEINNDESLKQLAIDELEKN